MLTRRPEPLNKTLEELVVRYALHPNLCDIYVEGESDRRLVRWFLEVNDRQAVSIYPVNTIDIPADVLALRSLNDSARDRVFVVALVLEEKLGKNLRVTCVADRDFDDILGGTTTAEYLVLTDYTSMEMYAYAPATVHKVSRLLGYSGAKTGQQVLDELEPLLKLLFLFRLANHVLALGLHWIDFDKCCSLKGDAIEFDREEHLTRYLNTKGRGSERERFCETVANHEAKAVEPRRSIRGHDFVDVLAWYLSQHRKKSPHIGSDAVRDGLYLSLSPDNLKGEHLFEKLLAGT